MSDEKLLDDKLIDDWKPEQVEWRRLWFAKNGNSALGNTIWPSEAAAMENVPGHLAWARESPNSIIEVSTSRGPIKLCTGKDLSHVIPIPRVKT